MFIFTQICLSKEEDKDKKTKEDGTQDAEKQVKVIVKEDHPKAKKSLCRFLDLSLCRDPVFLLMTASVMCMSLGVPHFLIFLPSHARSAGEDESLAMAKLMGS